MTVKRVLLVVCVIVLCACQPAAPETPTLLPTGAPPATPSFTPTPPIEYPSGINPLTGQPAANPSLLKIPAALISISHFPATARPQAGLSFAPFVYEYYITEGTTRFLAVFYGEFPAPELPVTGDCPVRGEPFVQTGTLLGNRVWLDANNNGLQDVWEKGIGGVCVSLYDANGNPLQQTTTDSNGYYGFNVRPGAYIVLFARPPGMDFAQADVGEDALDSDVDPATGQVEAQVASDNLSVDAGLALSPGATPTQNPNSYLPLAQVGPVRSGRLIYRYIADYFANSCLMFAGASPEELKLLPQCYLVFHQLAGGGYMLDISQMEQIARDNKKKKGSDFDYASNLFAEETPSGGAPASKLNVYFAYQNQSGWIYDPLYQAYLRYVDTSEYDQAGILHPDTDRLTGRQLHFENLIVMFAEHQVISPTNLDIHLDPGKTGKALLVRDGQMFKIKLRTSGPAEGNNPRPISFVNADDSLVPLRPGHSWIIVVTPDTTVEEKSAGQWLLNFKQPEGAK